MAQHVIYPGVFYVHLRRMYILLPGDGMLCIYPLSLSGLMCHLRQVFPIDFLPDLSIDAKGVLNSPTIYSIAVYFSL